MAKGKGSHGGGGGRGRGGGRGGMKGRGGPAGPDGQGKRGQYNTIDMRNPRLEAYYLDQNIVNPKEWYAFMQSLRTALPTTFRITAGKHTTSQITKAMKEIFVPFLQNVTYEGEKIEPPKNLPWYPEGLGWHIKPKKVALRKSPELKRFHHFLVHETDVGSISRQEAVSMLPPLFLNVRPEHLVLDMCAAPGSKTAQLIESLHSPVTASADAYEPMPAGLVVANDSDTVRAHLLVHQAQRLPSPNLIVTNLDASRFPAVKVPWKAATKGAAVEQVEMKFDRVLADVPCSGDGTLRKNMPIWKDWTPNNAVGLHGLQLKILMRGLSLLRDGGRLVYSTCSMNPIENEAVVAEAIRLSKGKVKVVDCSDKLPDLIRRKGMTIWKAAPGKGAHLFGKSKDIQRKREAEASTSAEAATAPAEDEEQVYEPGTPEYRDRLPEIAWIDSWDQLNELDASLATSTPKSLWPKGDEIELGLENCMRLYPHLQDTGGFFVTVLEKVGDVDAESIAAGMIRAMEELDANAPEPEALSTAIKRELSPPSDEPATKRVKEEEVEEDDDADAPGEIDMDAVTNVKEDKHASDRAAKHAKRNDSANDGFGMPGGLPYKEDPFAYVPHTNKQIQSCLKFFNLKPDFPSRNFLVRNPEHNPVRSVYFTSTAARALITGGGPGRGPHPFMNPLQLRLINCGVKSLGRQDAGKDVNLECKWRITNDGLLSIRPHIQDSSIIRCTLSDLTFLVANYFPTIERVQGDFGEAVRARKIGNHIIDVVPSEHDGHKLDQTMSFPIWRAVNSVHLMLDKQERSALSFRLFDTDVSNPDGSRQFSAQPGKKGKKAAATTTDDVEMQLADAEDAARASAAAAKMSQPTVILSEYQSDYIQLALDSEVLRFDGPFTLKSGRQSPYFFNAGLFNTGSKVSKVAECYAKRIVESGVKFDVLFGPAYKGIPLAAATALALHANHGIDVGFCFNRKEAKTHGEGGSLVGAPLVGKVLILDDVITAGTAINQAMEIIFSQKGAELAGVVIALDRQEKSVKDSVEGETSAIAEVEKKYKTQVMSVVNLDQIIEYMKQKREGAEKQIEGMKDYRTRYGVSEVVKAQVQAANK